MTYKGKKISSPTYEMFWAIAHKKKYIFNPEDALEYTDINGYTKTSIEQIASIFNKAVEKEWIKQSKRYKDIHGHRLPRTKDNLLRISKEVIENAKQLKSTIIKEKAEKKLSGSEKYKESLTTPQWLAFREFIFVVRGKKCESCGETHNLNIHHPKYKSNRKPWEYTCNEVVVLCHKCHNEAHGLDG